MGVEYLMQILIISGSRNPEGRTAQLINALRQGIDKAGGSSEVLFLPQMKIERCRQCNSDGWGICRTEHRCIIEEDDFSSIVEKVKKANLVVFATPVYFSDLSESLRAFLDRLRRTRFVIGVRELPPMPTEQSIPALGLCFAGGSGNGTASCLVNLERILQTCGFDVVDMIAARRQNLKAKLPVLEQVGAWLVTKPSSLKSNLRPI
jgi:NAD(P)H-dependent FMN reductase